MKRKEPQAATGVFVAYDFLIKGGLPDVISALSKKPPQGYVVRWTGAEGGRKQGDLWKHVVAPGIGDAERVVAYVDLPNANVGFEIGYALGLGKLVAITRCRGTKPGWLDCPPLNGSLCEQAETIDKLRTLVTRADDWNQASPPSQPGVDVLFLCPRAESGSAYVEQKPTAWRMVPKDGWGVSELGTHLAKVGMVVWVIAPHHEGPPGRDGAENAALSVVAGYAEARGIQLHVLVHEDARSVADVVARRRAFGNLEGLELILKEIDLSHRPQKTTEVTGAKPPSPRIPQEPIQSEAMLRLLYADTAPSRRPFAPLRVDQMNWELVLKYANAERMIDPQDRDQPELLSDLCLLSTLSTPPMLHLAALLCFHNSPHLLKDTAVAKFVLGSGSSPEDIRVVTGPLSEQIDKLVDLVVDRLRLVPDFTHDASRGETLEIPRQLIRELISNAVAHRDYDAPGNVQIRLTKSHLEVESPGVFASGLSWDSLLRSSAQHSQPRDPAVSRYLNALLKFEGIGRGFEVIRQYIRDHGEGSIICQIEHAVKTLIRVKRRPMQDRPSAGVTQVYLSWVTREFGALRARLARMVRRTRLSLRHQEEFAHHGVVTLQMLEEELNMSDVVVHVIGGRGGAPVPANQVEDLLKRHPGFHARFPEIAADGRAGTITYTQWEAWLALFFRKRLCVYQLVGQDSHPDPHQQTHVARLRNVEQHPKETADVPGLLEEILASLVDLHLLTQKDLDAKPSNLPYPPLGELFIGRGPFLEDLRRRFEESRRKRAVVWSTQAVIGMAGVGKTRLAVEYAWKYRDDYTALLFVSGESPGVLDSQLAHLASVVRVDVPDGVGDPDRRVAVLDWLGQHPGWLLIVDNVDDRAARDAVNALLRDWHRGHILITGRYDHWGRDVERLALDVLAPDEAAAFLERSTVNRRPQPDDPQTARELADDLGGLCMALEQCSAYVNRLEITLAEYHRRWQANVKDVRTWSDKVLMKYHEEKAVSLSIATTWHATMQQLTPSARDLLHLFAWLAPAPIPTTFLDAVEKRGTFGGNVEQAAAELRGYSLLQKASETDFETCGEVHRLVQLIVREQMAEDQKTASLPSAIAAVNDAFAGDPTDIRAWPVLNPLAAHTAEVIRHADAAAMAEPTTRLMNQLGLLYEKQIRFLEAETLYRRALVIDQQSFGKDHPTVAGTLNNLARLLQDTNRLSEAEPLMRRALAIDEQSFGKDHPTVARTLNNLARQLQDTNRLSEAEPLMRRALAIDEYSFGKDHAKVAMRLTNLGLLLQATNRLDEAEPLMRRALAIDEQVFGSDHPNVATDLHNLAKLLQDTNRLAEAEPIMTRVVAIFEKSLGENHPSVAAALSNLAALFQATNRLEEAEALMRRALAVDEAVLGTEHPKVAIRLHNLAALLRATNRLTEAEPLMRRTVEIFRRFAQKTGYEHPDLKPVLANYAGILEVMGRSE